MATQYRILERLKYKTEKVFIAQRTVRFLGLFPYWSSYLIHHYDGDYELEFETFEKAKAHIAEDAKWDNWNGTNKDRVIALFQVDENGVLTEVV